MPAPLRIALAQINSTVGDLDGNASKILDYVDRAQSQGAQLVVFPELALCGYPPEDLLLRSDFLEANRQALARLAASVTEIVAIVGFPEANEGAVFNAAAVLADGQVETVYRKILLPNYGVFDEQRYFAAGNGSTPFEVGGMKLGLTICEDIWEPGPVLPAAVRAGAEAIINISASPYHQRKGKEREQMLSERARESGVPVVLCNMVGGQDELVFDGHSVAADAAGGVVARGDQFEEELVVFDIGQPGEPASLPLREVMSADEEVYRALVLGTHDYVEKNGFTGVLVGVSGGIDSALVATVAADALGAECVRVAVMPSPFSSDETQADARLIASNLGVRAYELPIGSIFAAFGETLAEAFAGTESGVAEENLQARIRGALLMALSNRFGWLLLTTGNKSEYAVGYTTLYGDMAGGFAVLKDVPKTLVYELARYRNAHGGETTPIPESVIARAPSAELRLGQLDSDSLPPYEVLDPLLEDYVERDLGRAQLIEAGHQAELVDRVIALVDRAEYKRRQAPPGVRIKPKAFGRDRRLPITNKYRSPLSS